MKKKLILILLLTGVLLVSGCELSCPKCPEPGSYSECNDQAVKLRTNYRCSEVTDFQCESYAEEKQCATAIKLEGDLDVTVKPTIEEKVKGIIKIEITGAPEDTTIVGYVLEGGDLPPVSERGPSLASDQGEGVWRAMIDTTQYKNGLYNIGVMTSNKIDMEENKGSPPTAYAQGQIVISN